MAFTSQKDKLLPPVCQIRRQLVQFFMPRQLIIEKSVGKKQGMSKIPLNQFKYSPMNSVP